MTSIIDMLIIRELGGSMEIKSETAFDEFLQYVVGVGKTIEAKAFVRARKIACNTCKTSTNW